MTAAAAHEVRGPGRALPAPRRIDEIDRQLLRLLTADARLPNNALAEAVGIAPSTCLNRIRQLRDSGVIRGFHADVDPAALGRPLRAMIAVRLRAGARDRMLAFLDRIRRRPEVVDVYFLGGADDFLVNIAVADTAAVREFVVDALSAHPEVAHTETNLIFEHYRGTAAD